MAVNNQEVVAPRGPQGPADGMSFPLGAVNQEGLFRLENRYGI